MTDQPKAMEDLYAKAQAARIERQARLARLLELLPDSKDEAAWERLRKKLLGGKK